jgi:hypothetical protein
MMKKIVLLIPFLTACASTDYNNYLKAQQEANAQAAQNRKPLIEITAQPGQAITGLAGLKVYMPESAPVIQQQRENEWARVVGQGLSVLGTVGGIYYGGKAAAGLASEVRQAGTAGYAHIQAPGAISTVTTTTTNTTTNTNTMTGSEGVLGSGTYSLDSTHTPTVVLQPDPIIVRPTIVEPTVITP